MWGNPAVVNASGDFNDKNWATCDHTTSSPFFSNCYTEFDDNTLGDLVLMSASSDVGLTWGRAQTTASNLHGISGQPVARPDGTVVVPIVGFAGNQFTMVSFTSTNGGAGWGKTQVIAKWAQSVRPLFDSDPPAPAPALPSTEDQALAVVPVRL